MKLDMRDAWNDENAHLNVSDAQLESVYGGGGFPLGLGPAGVGVPVGPATAGAAAASSQACETRVHSFSVLCDISIFSLNAIVLPIVNIANQTNQICANQH